MTKKYESEEDIDWETYQKVMEEDLDDPHIEEESRPNKSRKGYRRSIKPPKPAEPKKVKYLMRWCKRCDAVFIPTGKFCVICDKCMEIAKEKGKEKTRAYLKKKKEKSK